MNYFFAIIFNFIFVASFVFVASRFTFSHSHYYSFPLQVRRGEPSLYVCPVKKMRGEEFALKLQSRGSGLLLKVFIYLFVRFRRFSTCVVRAARPCNTMRCMSLRRVSTMSTWVMKIGAVGRTTANEMRPQSLTIRRMVLPRTLPCRRPLIVALESPPLRFCTSTATPKSGHVHLPHFSNFPLPSP